MQKTLLATLVFLMLSLAVFAWTGEAQDTAVAVNQKRSAVDAGLIYIDTSFENASPLWYEYAPDGTVLIHLLYDQERSSPNRAAGHIHFLLHGKPGSKLVLEFKNLNNVWNSQPASVARELKMVVVSENGLDWQPLTTESLPEDRVRLALTMPGPRLYVARLEPYRLSDLDRLLDEIGKHPLVEITSIGQTVQGRRLEIVRVGKPEAPYRVFLRARAHPWESGGNWVVEGLIRRLLQDDVEIRRFSECYCIYVVPMANKDGVARGMTRFNLQGKDLNRNWDKVADPQLAPENAALEKWLEGRIREGQRPHLALELHNDGYGLLHLGHPSVSAGERYLQRMKVLEGLLRKFTWFSEGSAAPSFTNPGSFNDGWLERYGIDAITHEFHCSWIAGLDSHPSAKHWQNYGRNLAQVFYEYFQTVKP